MSEYQIQAAKQAIGTVSIEAASILVIVGSELFRFSNVYDRDEGAIIKYVRGHVERLGYSDIEITPVLDDDGDGYDFLREANAHAAANEATQEDAMLQLDDALRRVAAAQKRLGLRSVITTVTANGAGLECKMWPSGGTAVTYALVDRNGVVHRQSNLPPDAKKN
ncbi:hypothetical protein [Hyphomicrobium sp. D-2]|uniref:hypothetical protein n=1 Tax=Hyphomicrobium sp. D-2 TaxID=3041621 RepID=UPI002456275F|nr:hypothetical protein [Hyphomicrobium sp. D-2]MDH4982162.1 hypothetical protein [Hyphomicrobium sp. D-2]